MPVQTITGTTRIALTGSANITGSAWIDKQVDMDKIISHAQKLVRDMLRVFLTDPLNRGADWIFTAFPRRDIRYPLIAISQPTMSKSPMGASDTLIEEGTIALDISIYSKTTLQRDQLADAVLALEKAKRLDLRDYGLFDARVTACYDAEFDAAKEVFRKIAVIQFGIVG